MPTAHWVRVSLWIYVVLCGATALSYFIDTRYREGFEDLVKAGLALLCLGYINELRKKEVRR